jgi:hypothetical protein
VLHRLRLDRLHRHKVRRFWRRDVRGFWRPRVREHTVSRLKVDRLKIGRLKVGGLKVGRLKVGRHGVRCRGLSDGLDPCDGLGLSAVDVLRRLRLDAVDVRRGLRLGSGDVRSRFGSRIRVWSRLRRDRRRSGLGRSRGGRHRDREHLTTAPALRLPVPLGLDGPAALAAAVGGRLAVYGGGDVLAHAGTTARR